MARVAIVYYSATGHVHRLAHAVGEGAEAEGAEVRVRHVEELASEMLISQNQYWGGHRSEVVDERRSQCWTISSGRTGSRSGRRPGSATSRRS